MRCVFVCWLVGCNHHSSKHIICNVMRIYFVWHNLEVGQTSVLLWLRLLLPTYCPVMPWFTMEMILYNRNNSKNNSNIQIALYFVVFFFCLVGACIWFGLNFYIYYHYMAQREHSFFLLVYSTLIFVLFKTFFSCYCCCLLVFLTIFCFIPNGFFFL